MTFANQNIHGPEISYLKHEYNGLLLSDSLSKNVGKIANMMCDPTTYSEMCVNAYKTGQELSVENWCSNVKDSFTKVLRRDPHA